jgi:hypothetical protein
MLELNTSEEPRRKTFEYLRAKHAAISNSGGSPLDAYDLDLFLVRLPDRYWDSYLDSVPSVESVNELVEAAVPRWPLVSRGAVNEVNDFLAARRARGLATIRQTRLLRDLGHPRPGAVLFVDVSTELRCLLEGRRLC